MPTMAKVSLQQALEIGLQKHQSDQFKEAEDIYTQVLRHDPGNSDALHFLGVLKHQLGDNDRAAELLQQSIARDSSIAASHHNFGLVLGKLGRHADAIVAFRRAVELEPNHAEAWNNLGGVLRETGDIDGAHAACSRAVELNPNYPEAYSHLAAILADQNRLEESVACFRKAITLNPNFPEAKRNYAAVLVRLAQRHNEQGRLTEAIAAWSTALEQNPDLAGAHNDLGGALANQGRAIEGISHYQKATSLRPDFANAHSNLLLAMNYLPGIDGATFLSSHRGWDEKHAASAHSHGLPSVGFFNDRAPDRILRIGYVSPDFRQHPVCYFIESLIAGHHREKFHVTCYANVPNPDGVTERFRHHADQWRDISETSDADVASRVRADQIDVLIDLAGHTGHHRLGVFTHRAAPVQATYCGYPNTTGLAAMDYRLTDALSDPEGAETFHSEKLIRLPKSFLCFSPAAESPEFAELPAATAGYVTFGCFNNLAKVTAAMLDTWAEILLRVPGSRLAMKNKSFADPDTRDRVVRQLADRGIDASRFIAMPPTQGIAEHLACYGQVDISLDTFPYHGTTTTCESLWMGVPVVSLAGNLHVSRVGVSILTNVDMLNWIADSIESYIETAVRHAGDLAALRSIRADLRDRMRQSPLMDRERFVTDFEAACRGMWRKWCETSSDEAPKVIQF
jgi:predicted O-linked N-acetylglucosamine transferase (SPINDLY family)